MDQALRTLLAILLLVSSAFGEPKAVINGPTVAPAGEGVLITAEGSTGDNLVWIMPDNLSVFTCNTNQLFFSTTKVGKYEFILIAADKEAQVAYARHIVTVGTTTPPTTPEIPTPALDVGKISKDSAPDDSPTKIVLKRVLLQTHANIQALCDVGRCPPIEVAIAQYQQVVQDTLLSRPRGSQSSWFGWRQVLENTIVEIKPTTIEQIQNIWLAITTGL